MLLWSDGRARVLTECCSTWVMIPSRDGHGADRWLTSTADRAYYASRDSMNMRSCNLLPKSDEVFRVGLRIVVRHKYCRVS
jgi:hypothetical protein